MAQQCDELEVPERILKQAAVVFGGIDRARNWMGTPRNCFAGRSPIEMLKTHQGAEAVEEMLGQIDEGMFA